MSDEIWLPIKDFPYYEISSFGNIRSIPHRIKRKSKNRTEHFVNYPGRELKPFTMFTSYTKKKSLQQIRLYHPGRAETKKIHSLVLTAFKGERPAGMECCHNDGNSMNNHIDNLRWDTHKNNALDMKKHGNCPGFKKGQNCSTGISKGIERWNCILTEEQVLEIRANKNKLSQRKLASMYNVTRGTIQSAIDRKSWKHI